MPTVYQVLEPRDHPALLSLVIPLYNECEVVPILRAQMEKFLGELACSAESSW